MGESLGRVRTCPWRGRCPWLPSGTQQVCLDSSVDGLPATSRQGCSSVNLFFQQAFMEHRLCARPGAAGHWSRGRSLLTHPQFPWLPGITIASLLRKLCLLLLPEGQLHISTHPRSWTMAFHSPAYLFCLLLRNSQEALLAADHVWFLDVPRMPRAGCKTCITCVPFPLPSCLLTRTFPASFEARLALTGLGALCDHCPLCPSARPTPLPEAQQPPAVSSIFTMLVHGTLSWQEWTKSS